MMKLEEAINIIKDYEIYPCGICHTGSADEITEAFNMAIEALKRHSINKRILKINGVRSDISEVKSKYDNE